MDRCRHRGRLALRAAALAARLGGRRAGEGEDEALDRKLHQTIAAMGANIEALAFNKAVANIYELANAIEKAPPSASRTRGGRDDAAAGRADGAACRRGGLGGGRAQRA